MKVLVTGGAGFIGSNIVDLLLQRGDEVTVLDNLSSGHRSNVNPDVRFVDGDIRDLATVATAAEGVEAIFHLAASVGNQRSLNDPQADATTNVIGTLNVLESARKAGARKVVYSSSAGIFGELKTLPIREDHPLEPDTPYGVSKLAGEKDCLAYGRLYGLETVCLRYFNVFGRRQRYDAYGNVIPIFATLLLTGKELTIFGDGEQTRDFINVRDVARANIAAADSHGVSGAFNLGSATSITINALVKMLHDVSGVEPCVRYAPPRPGDVRDSLADISAVRSKLGFTPQVEIRQGLHEYIGWLRGELGVGQ